MDVNEEVAKVLSQKLHISLDEARVVVFVSQLRNSKGDMCVGPLPDIQCQDGWVSRDFIVSSGYLSSAIDSLLQKGLLIPRPNKITNTDDSVWVRVPDAVGKSVDAAYDEVERRPRF